MMISHKKPRIGVLALMLGAYEPLFPGFTARQTAYVNQVLKGLINEADFTFPHAALGREDIEALTRQYNHDGLDGILILLLSYSQGQYLVHAMQDNALPLALALIAPDETATDEFGELELTVNQGIHGSQDNANCLMRAKIPCAYYAGSRHGTAFQSFIADFGAAAQAVRAMRHMKIGVIGKLSGMGDVISDDMAFYRILGPEFIYDSIGTVNRFCEQVTQSEIDARVARERVLFDIDPALPAARHAYAVKLYLGLQKYLTANNYDGYTAHFEEFGEDGRFEQLPLLAASSLMADGYGYAAEGDATTAALMAAMRVLCGEANFSEMYMMDLKRRAILLCHAGEGNYATCRTDQKPYLLDRVMNEGGLSNPPTPIFTPRPGRASVLSLVHVTGEHFRLVVSHGEVLDEHGLKNCDMPYLFFRPDGGVEQTVTNWLEKGGTHHETIVLGEHRQRIALFAKLLHIELCEL